jgi:SAM-dependent methyltransferase
MAHDPKHKHGDHDHAQDPSHGHSHSHGHDRTHDHGHLHSHDHHNHHPDDHHHDWHSPDYVQSWVARDSGRAAERKPIIERMVAAVPFPHDAEIAVLDIGGGSGALTAAVLESFPRAHAVLQDFSPPMLERARARFRDRGDQVRYALGDLSDPAWVSEVGGPFDLAVSGIAIHNLHDLGAIAACYQGIYPLIKSGGCFLDYDHFDRVGGVPLHQHSLKVAGFSRVETVWHEFPTAILKASV